MRLIYFLVLNLIICFRLNAQWSDLNLGVNGRVSSMYLDPDSGLLWTSGLSNLSIDPQYCHTISSFNNYRH